MDINLPAGEGNAVKKQETVKASFSEQDEVIIDFDKEEDETEGLICEDTVRITVENLEEFKEYLDPQAAKDVKRPFYRGLAAYSKDGETPGAIIVYEYKNLDEEYAAYRVLKAQVDEKDVDYLLRKLKETTDPGKRDRIHGLLGLVETKHSGMVIKKLEEDEKMRDPFWDYFKPQIDEEVNTAVADHTRTNLYVYVQDGAMSIDYAARQANVSADQFRTEMAAHGYKIPQAQTV